MALDVSEVNRIICLQLGLSEVRRGDHFRDDLGAESLDLQNIVAALEDKYGVVLDDEDIVKLETVGDCYQCLEAKGV